MSIIARLNDDQRWFRGGVGLRIDRMTPEHRSNILRTLVCKAEEFQTEYLEEILGARGPVEFDTGYATVADLLADIDSCTPAEWILRQKLARHLTSLGATIAPEPAPITPVAFLYDRTRWETREGRVMRPERMSWKHRQNALRVLAGGALYYREQELIFQASQEPDEHREVAISRLREQLETLTHRDALAWLMKLPLPRRLADLNIR